VPLTKKSNPFVFCIVQWMRSGLEPTTFLSDSSILSPLSRFKQRSLEIDLFAFFSERRENTAVH
jgi:hypothetical protein